MMVMVIMVTVRGDRHVSDASPIVGEEHQDEQEAVGRRWNHEEIQAHHSRKPRRCQAMTVSGLTITSAVRHPAQVRASKGPKTHVNIGP